MKILEFLSALERTTKAARGLEDSLLKDTPVLVDTKEGFLYEIESVEYHSGEKKFFFNCNPAKDT
jgi:hypothetical protein